MRALEQELVDTQRLDAFAVLTEKDGEFLSRFDTRRPFYVVDTGLRAPDVSRLPDRAPEPNGVMFIGNFRHYPNEDAVNFFFEKIDVPEKVLRQVPGLKVYIVGAHPTPAVLARHDGRRVIVARAGPRRAALHPGRARSASPRS